MPAVVSRLLLSGVLAWFVAIPAKAGDRYIRVGDFSAAAPDNQHPAHWEPLTFTNIESHTHYDLVVDSETQVVRARSHASASGLVRKVDIDPGVYPRVRWRWKVSDPIASSDVTSKQGDDYPARLYITFALDADRLGTLERLKYEAYRLIYGEYPPLAAISYIWGGKSAPGTMIPNAYTDRVMMFVLQNSSSPLDRWMENERNIHEDYLRAFGEAPPPVSGVAIMTDSDNTGERATAYYGDIVFSR